MVGGGRGTRIVAQPIVAAPEPSVEEMEAELQRLRAEARIAEMERLRKLAEAPIVTEVPHHPPLLSSTKIRAPPGQHYRL
jgi:hypothetical protein